MTDEMVASDSAVAGQGDARHRWDRIALGVIAIATLPVGLQAAFTPRSFYNDFPLGRHWIALDGGAYNEHLVRDVGVLFLALILVTGWVVIRRLPTQSVAAAWLLQGTLHVIQHARHLHGYKMVDAFGLVGSLALVPVLAVVAWWSVSRRPSCVAG